MPSTRTIRRGWTAAASLLAAATVATVAMAAGGDGTPSAPLAAEPAPPPVFSHPRTIDNPYLPLTAFKRCEYRGVSEDGTRTRSVITVLGRTKRFVVAGQPVEVAVIKDEAFEAGELVESTLDYFAQADDGTVYYFGEQVRNIEDGTLVNTHGTWLYGVHTDVLGVAMPAQPTVGALYRFEDVPGITTESNRVEETGLRVRAGGKVHREVIRTQEFVQPEGEVEYKLYAPGVGLVVEYAPDGRSHLSNCR